MTDHIVPAQGKDEIFWKDGNYLPLCAPCHNTVTTMFDRNFKGTDKETEDKIGWMNTRRTRFQVLKDRRFKMVRVIWLGKEDDKGRGSEE